MMTFKRFTTLALCTAVMAAAMMATGAANVADAAGAQQAPAFRPPSVPLVTFNPFLSVWSPADKLTDAVTTHWTRRPHSLLSMIRIDGKAWRLMGVQPESVPAFPQTGLQVTPTRSIYDFDDGHVHVTLTFMTAALPHDLEVLARPLTYLTWQVRAVDGAAHEVAIFDSTSSELVVNTTSEKVEWKRETMGALTALRAGTVEQPVLGSAGDDHRINWGYVYAAAPSAQARAASGGMAALTGQFAAQGTLAAADDTSMPRAVSNAAAPARGARRGGAGRGQGRGATPESPTQPVLAFAFDLGKVAAAPVERHLMVAYDEVYAIKFFGKKLRPYWRRNGAEAADLLQAAERDYPSLVTRCAAFDKELLADLTAVGGEKYAQICATAYRECQAANGIAADENKQPMMFTKENTSNGDIATVDVMFPGCPQFVFLSPTLAKASMVAVLNYADSGRWKFPCSPHDLGTYPIVRGTDDGGEAMPVEESGNMLIMCDAIAHAEGNADFVTPWWPLLTKWADYLVQYGLDPEEQLCTDDFMGRLAHNSNLSVKAIVALAAYGDLCKLRGDTAGAERYAKLAKDDATHWVKAAADGDHFNIAFDKPGTWSQKYNLVWDKILGLGVFPPEIAQKEIAHYKTVMQPYGLPLDSRTHLTKADWTIWSATMAERREDFEGFITPVYKYYNETTTRDPLADSYQTDNPKSGGMHARPVMGGVFIKMLTAPEIWKKWAARDTLKVGGWMKVPPKPQATVLVPTGQAWKYTTQAPAADWFKPGFDDSAWKTGPAGFGAGNPPGIQNRTTWNGADIWIRREITMPDQKAANLELYVYHDEDVQIYANGVLAAQEAGFVTAYSPLEIKDAAKGVFQPGAKIVLAAHCHQSAGGQGIDIGLADVK